uniref:Uncharacterized protein AlNc14C45G3646 n=1 Tax=Albugo laibachii Nc14 TaxID=890382 RepID=F0WAB7_9STRA|nr:conserved hypothetical protein [Albugo laibachii Nc14]|eukprot:CCA18087.1 conserved hypothetical protein [Albugo laibachii Nc14]
MHQEQLSFVTVQQILSDVTTYRLAAEVLRKFSIHPIPTVTKTPNAFNASTSKRAPLRLSDIVQVLPKTMLTKCRTQIFKLQKKNARLAENQAAVEIPGIGIYTPLLLNLMSRWHKAVAVLDQVDAAEEWLKSFEGEPMIGFERSLSSEVPHEFGESAAQSESDSSETDLLSLVGKSPLMDGAVAAVLRRLFQAEKGVTLMPALLAEATDCDGIREMFRGVFDNNVTAHVFVPLNLGNAHWCGIVVHLSRQEILCYDPMASSYTLAARKVALELSRLYAQHYGIRFRVRAYEASSGIQDDTYNCSVFLMLFAEETILGKRAGRVFEIQESIQALVAVWYKLTIDNFPNDDKCKLLKTTLAYRLLYGLKGKNLECVMQQALNQKTAGGLDVYTYTHGKENTITVPMQRKVIRYEEMIGVIESLRDIGVTPFMISASHEDYLLVARQVFGIKIDFYHMIGSELSLKKTKAGFANAGKSKANTVSKIRDIVLKKSLDTNVAKSCVPKLVVWLE